MSFAGGVLNFANSKAQLFTENLQFDLHEIRGKSKEQFRTELYKADKAQINSSSINPPDPVF